MSKHTDNKMETLEMSYIECKFILRQFKKDFKRVRNIQ